jgi:hypothetical protein
LRWRRADAHPGSGDARGRRATLAYPFASGGRYSDPYGYRVAHTCRYAPGNLNADAFPYVAFAHTDAPADAHNNGHADAPADTNAGSHTHRSTGRSRRSTDFAADDL